MPKYTTDEDLALLAELGVDTKPSQPIKYSPKDQRIIAGFEEVERFVQEHGRLPQHGEDRDIFERLYAVRLDRMRESAECCKVLKPLDSQGLLEAKNDTSKITEMEELTDEALLASLGVEADSDDDITQLTHVRSHSEIKAAEEIAQRSPCQDFEKFKPLFKQVQQELETGKRKTLKYQENAKVSKGNLFILDGQKVLVADVGESFVSDYGRQNSRLRVVYDNGTESDLLLRSLQRALNKDENSRRIIQSELGETADLGPLFSGIAEEEDLKTGYIYVLRSQSEHPSIAKHRSVLHKIGVTGGDVKKRIANAKNDPTYLLADVEIVTTFKLMNIDRKGLEAILHKFFSSARLEIELEDRFGKPVKPREWFLVPLNAIEEVVEKIKEGTLDQFRYDPKTASLKS